MGRTLLIGIFMFLFVFSIPDLSWASTVSGTVTKIEGSVYVIKDSNQGDEHRIRVDSSTEMQGTPKEGSQVEVEVDDQSGRAKSIKVKT